MRDKIAGFTLIAAGGWAALGAEDAAPMTRDGVMLHGWWAPVEGAPLATLFLQGNAGDAGHRGRPIRAITAARSPHGRFRGLLEIYVRYAREVARPRTADFVARLWQVPFPEPATRSYRV